MYKLKDEELMELYISGDFKAFNELYGRYSKKLYGYIMNKVKSRDKADNIFQELFYKIHKNKETFDSRFTLNAWIFTICHNEVINHFRNNNKEHNVAYDDEILVNSEAELPMESDKFRYDKMVEEIAKLPQNQRETIKLKFFSGLKSKEIAEKLQKKDALVRKLISRGMIRLREKLMYENK